MDKHGVQELRPVASCRLPAAAAPAATHGKVSTGEARELTTSNGVRADADVLIEGERRRRHGGGTKRAADSGGTFANIPLNVACAEMVARLRAEGGFAFDFTAPPALQQLPPSPSGGTEQLSAWPHSPPPDHLCG